MERNNSQLTFFDGITSEPGGRRTAEFFARCDKYIPPEQLKILLIIIRNGWTNHFDAIIFTPKRITFRHMLTKMRHLLHILSLG